MATAAVEKGGAAGFIADAQVHFGCGVSGTAPVADEDESIAAARTVVDAYVTIRDREMRLDGHVAEHCTRLFPKGAMGLEEQEVIARLTALYDYIYETIDPRDAYYAATDPVHGPAVLEWARTLTPGGRVGVPLGAAALFHDIERVAADVRVPRLPSAPLDETMRKQVLHPLNCARILEEILKVCGLSPQDIEDACLLVRHHDRVRDDAVVLRVPTDCAARFSAGLPSSDACHTVGGKKSDMMIGGGTNNNYKNNKGHGGDGDCGDQDDDGLVAVTLLPATRDVFRDDAQVEQLRTLQFADSATFFSTSVAAFIAHSIDDRNAPRGKVVARVRNNMLRIGDRGAETMKRVLETAEKVCAADQGALSILRDAYALHERESAAGKS